MSRMSFKINPDAWRGNVALRSCSIAARGLWIELLCLMSQGVPYGHLASKGKPLNDEQIARLCGISMTELYELMGELERAEVFGRTESGVIFARELLREEHIRKVRVSAGKHGGNPRLVKRKKEAQTTVCLSKRFPALLPPPISPSFPPTPPYLSSFSPPPSSHPSLLPASGFRRSEDLLKPTAGVLAADAIEDDRPAQTPKDGSPDGGQVVAENRGGDDLVPPLELTPLVIEDDTGRCPPCPYERIVAAYHEKLPTLPRVLVLNASRRRLVSGRWREAFVAGEFSDVEGGVRYFAEYFARVSRSRFLTGRSQTTNGRPPFTADFEWLVRPNNYAKVVEGRYDGKPTSETKDWI